MTGIGPVVMSLVPVIQQAASIIGAVAGGIGSAISVVAPVVTTIMSEIGDKIGGVVEFLAERSDFIQSVIETAGPAIAKVLETAWGIISPVMDILITTFGAGIWRGPEGMARHPGYNQRGVVPS
ncbi:MAG: hypothetical protein ACLSAC_12375 [Enterocloster bolteae]